MDIDFSEYEFHSAIWKHKLPDRGHCIVMIRRRFLRNDVPRGSSAKMFLADLAVRYDRKLVGLYLVGLYLVGDEAISFVPEGCEVKNIVETKCVKNRWSGNPGNAWFAEPANHETETYFILSGQLQVPGDLFP